MVIHFLLPGISIILGIIDSKAFKNQISTMEQRFSKYSYKIATTIYSNCLFIIYILISRHSHEYKQQVIDQNAFDILIMVPEFFEDISDFRLKSYMSISNIFDENNVNQLVHVKSVTRELVGYIGACSGEINNKNLERFPVSFEESDKSSSTDNKTIIIQINESFFYLIDFLDVLYHYAVIEELKYEIYEICGMKKQLKMIILFGNSIERQYSVRLLWQVCYDQRVAENVLNDNALMSIFKDISVNSMGNSELLRNIKGILWLLLKDKSPYPRYETKLEDDSDLKFAEKHIMISYNKQTRDLCLAIKVSLIIFFKQLSFKNFNLSEN